MQPTLDIRRHGDGSIDYDFYRRRAKRRRRVTKQMIVKHCLAAGGRLASASVSAVASLMIDPSRQRSNLDLLARAGAVAAVLIAVTALQVWAQGQPMSPSRSPGGRITSY